MKCKSERMRKKHKPLSPKDQKKLWDELMRVIKEGPPEYPTKKEAEEAVKDLLKEDSTHG